MGEQPHLNFIISEFEQRYNRKSFDARFFSGASENENAFGFLLTSNTRKDSSVGKTSIYFYEKLPKMKEDISGIAVETKGAYIYKGSKESQRSMHEF